MFFKDQRFWLKEVGVSGSKNESHWTSFSKTFVIQSELRTKRTEFQVSTSQRFSKHWLLVCSEFKHPPNFCRSHSGDPCDKSDARNIIHRSNFVLFFLGFITQCEKYPEQTSCKFVNTVTPGESRQSFLKSAIRGKETHRPCVNQQPARKDFYNLFVKNCS